MIGWLSLLGLSGKGQNGYFACRMVRQDSSFSFPVFLPADGDTVAIQKINSFLQLAELYVLKGYGGKNLFKKVATDYGTIYGGKEGMNCRIESNSATVLSIGFDESSCGATCAYWVNYYNFNPGNGDLIQLRDLFTEKGWQQFRAIAAQKRVREFRRQVSRDSGLDYIPPCYREDDLTEFYIAHQSIYIDGQNCFHKNDKFFGIRTITRFRLDAFKDWLNAYGRALFGLAKNPIGQYHSIRLPQLYRGRIGRQKILLVLRPGEGNEMEAEYAYDRFGKGIYVTGRREKDRLMLTEYTDSSFDTVGYIDARIDASSIKGTWANKAGTRVYSFFVSRQ